MGNNYPNVHQLPQRTPKNPNGILLPQWEIIIQMFINYSKGPQMGNNYPNGHRLPKKDPRRPKCLKWYRKGPQMTQMGFYYPNGPRRPKWDFITQMGNNYPNVHQLPKRTRKNPM